jgi:hypothetical protein
VLRKIFGPKREVATGGWRKPYTEELHILYLPLKIVRVIESVLAKLGLSL